MMQALWFLFGIAAAASILNPQAAPQCTVKPGGSASIDDAPAIVAAFKECGQGGTVEFLNQTYYVNSVMNISGLHNCTIDLKGTLEWSTNISYWLNHSLPVGYQNQSTAFILGGNGINFNGNGYGTLFGNGDTWYTFIDNRDNYPGRPHALTLVATNSSLKGLRFIKSQMWSMSIINSSSVTLDSIYVNNTSSNGSHPANTDGADTIYSSHITFSNWIVDNGDDSISPKANSTDILIQNSTFYNGNGVALGSIGQYKGRFETLQRITASNIGFHNTMNAVYLKTWTGVQLGYPPNDGGGGLGFATDILGENLSFNDGQNAPFTITQCLAFIGQKANCSSSEFKIENLTFRNVTGTSSDPNVATFKCSGAAPCQNITITGVSITDTATNKPATGYECDYVDDPHGFTCTGSA